MEKLEKNFSKIYDQYVEKIYRFVYIKVSSQETAQDLTSETFVRTWESFKDGSEIENPRAFLYRVARNLIVDFYREKSRSQTISDEYIKGVVDPRVNLEQKALQNADLEKIRQALSSLKDEYQNVIVWHYIDDLKVPEIAQILDKSEDAVRVTIHRALKCPKRGGKSVIKSL